MPSPRTHSLKLFAFLLVAAFLIAEYALVQHAIEHSFQETDGVCFVCEKSDNFQNGLIASILPVQVPKVAELEPQAFNTVVAVSTQSLFQPRAPPDSISD